MARAENDGGRRSGYLATLSRHPGDLVRLVLALLALGLTALPVESSSVPMLEEDAFRFFNDLPGVLFVVIWLPMQLGSVGVVPAVTVLAAAARRGLLAVELAVGGVLAWGLAKAIKVFFDRPRPGVLLEDATLHGDVTTGLGYLSGHATIAAALATIAGPWLPRRVRRLAWAAALLVGASRLYVGAHFPLDVLGGYALGWAIGACVHLALGAPGGRPTAEVADRALRAMALVPHSLERADGTAFVATLVDGRRLHVRIVDRDHRDADLIHRSWRRLVSRWFREKPPFATPRQQLDHEAAVALLAWTNGVRVPKVVAVRAFGAGIGVLAEQRIDGAPLRDVAIDDALLDDVWRQVASLHDASIAHGDLHAGNVLIDADRQAWLVDFTMAESGPEPVRLHQDTAELLSSLRPLVGAATAVTSAHTALGPSALDPVAAFLDHARLGGESRAVRDARDDLLAELRQPAPRRG